MGSEWDSVLLKDVCSKIGSGATPRGGNSVYISEGEFSLIRSQNVRNDSFDHTGLAFLENYHAEQLSNVSVEEDDILLNITGDSVARCCQVDPSILPARVNQHVAIIRPEPTIVAPRFLRYYFVSPAMQSEMLSMAGVGATRNALTKGMIENFEIPLPPLPEQRAIAHILGSLDDKIELNRKMNETLEGMAQALFKSWFVDFDPVIDNALEAGNPIPEPLAKRAETRCQALASGTANRETAQQFPSSFHFTEELGWIPEGWEVKELGNTLRSVSDTYPLKTVDEVVFLNTGDILNGKFLHQDLSGTAGLPGQAKKSIRKGDILYSEIRPQNRRFAYVYFDGSKHVVSTKLMVLRAVGDISSMFAYLILTQDSTIDYLQMMAESRSGTFPQITFDIISKIRVALPQNVELVSFFTDFILKPTFQKQLQNDAMSNELTRLRNTLLPRLISGELRVPNAEDLTEEAMA